MIAVVVDSGPIALCEVAPHANAVRSVVVVAVVVCVVVTSSVVVSALISLMDVAPILNFTTVQGVLKCPHHPIR